MEKYIKSSDLAEVMEEVALTALDYADKVIVETTVRKFTSQVSLCVVVRDLNSFARLVEKEYRIISETLSPEEVSDETIYEALRKLDEAAKQAAQETPCEEE